VLLVLDNCEHLLQACADLLVPLLRGCPELHVLATSREPVGIDGEITWQVPSLRVPGPEHAASVADLEQTYSFTTYEALRETGIMSPCPNGIRLSAVYSAR
jgi:predicted ATPase